MVLRAFNLSGATALSVSCGTTHSILPVGQQTTNILTLKITAATPLQPFPPSRPNFLLQHILKPFLELSTTAPGIGNERPLAAALGAQVLQAQLGAAGAKGSSGDTSCAVLSNAGCAAGPHAALTVGLEDFAVDDVGQGLQLLPQQALGLQVADEVAQQEPAVQIGESMSTKHQAAGPGQGQAKARLLCGPKRCHPFPLEKAVGERCPAPR